MLSRELITSLKPRNRVLTAIWAAMFVACGVYVAVAFFVGDRPDAAQDGRWSPALLDVIFPGIAVALAAGALLLQRANLSPAALTKHWRRAAQQSAATAGAADPEPSPKYPRAQPPAEQRLLELAPLYLSTKIATWALLEAICILGLVLAILRGTPLTIMPYAGVAVVLLMLTRPDLTGFLAQSEALARRPL